MQRVAAVARALSALWSRRVTCGGRVTRRRQQREKRQQWGQRGQQQQRQQQQQQRQQQRRRRQQQQQHRRAHRVFAVHSHHGQVSNVPAQDVTKVQWWMAWKMLQKCSGGRREHVHPLRAALVLDVERGFFVLCGRLRRKQKNVEVEKEAEECGETPLPLPQPLQHLPCPANPSRSRCKSRQTPL